MILKETGRSRHSLVAVDPRSKFLLLLTSNVVMFSRPGLVLEISFVALLTILFMNNRQYLTAIKLAVVYTVLIVGDLYVVPMLPGVLSVLALTLVRITRLYIPIVLSFIYLIRTTTVSEFIAAFRKKMRFPETFIIPFTVMFRFFPDTC